MIRTRMQGRIHVSVRRGRLIVCGVLLFVAGSMPAKAQEMRIGARLGPAFGFFNDSAVPFVSEPGVTEAATNVRLDLNAGVHAVLPLSGPYAVQSELLFVQKGGHLTRRGSRFFASERYRLSYVQAHLLGRRDIDVSGPLSLHVVAGLTGAVTTGGRVVRNVRTTMTARTERIALLTPNLVRRWDVGLLLGGGVGYPVGRSGTLTLSLRYNPGIRSVFTDEARPPDAQSTFGDEPPPLTRTPPPLRHDVLLANVAYTHTISW